MKYPVGRAVLAWSGFLSLAVTFGPRSRGEEPTGDGPSYAKLERAVEVSTIFVGEMFSNLSGGSREGTVGASLLDVAVDFDLETLVGWEGMSLHSQVQGFLGGDPTAELVGDFNVVSNIVALNTVRLFQGWIQKEWDSGRYGIRAGVMALDDDFMDSKEAGLFLNSSFGPLPTESGNTDAPIFPVGGLGFLAYSEPVKSLTVQLGIYDGDAGDEEGNLHGFDISLNSNDGMAIFFDVGLLWQARGRLPGRVNLGGYRHTGTFESFGGTAAVDGMSSVHLVIDQALSVNQEDDTRVGSFFRTGYTPKNDGSIVSFYVDGGFTIYDFLPGRWGDIWGFGVSYTQFSDPYLSFRQRAGERVAEIETVIEITVQFKVRDWLTVQPDLQWILNPHDSTRDALAFGLRWSMEF